MNVRRLAAALCLGSFIVCTIACQQTEDAGSPRRVDSTAADVEKILPSVGLSDYFPVLDDGRIEIAAPDDWNPMPRDSRYLIRFYKNARNGLPRIEIKVEDGRYSEIATVTLDNVEEFARIVAADLESQGKKPAQPVSSFAVGKVPGVRYVSSLKLKMGDKTISAERQRLLVLHGGRLYTIDLMVLPATLKQSSDAAFAVCGGLRFIADSSLSEADEAGE